MGMFDRKRRDARSTSGTGGSKAATNAAAQELAAGMLQSLEDQNRNSGLWGATFRPTWFKDAEPTTRLALAREGLANLRDGLRMEPEWMVVTEDQDGILVRWWAGFVPLEVRLSFERSTAFGAAVAVDARLDTFEIPDPTAGGFLAARMNHERATRYGWNYDPRTKRLSARTSGIVLRPPAFAVGASVSWSALLESIHEMYGIGLLTVGTVLSDWMAGQTQWGTFSAPVHPARGDMRHNIPPTILSLGEQLRRMGSEATLAWPVQSPRHLFERFASTLTSEEQDRFRRGQADLRTLGARIDSDAGAPLRIPYPSYEPASVLHVGLEAQPYLGPGLLVVQETGFRVADDSVHLLISALVEAQARGDAGTNSHGWWYAAPGGSFSGFPCQPGEQLLGFATFIPQGRSRSVDPTEIVGAHVRRGWWLRTILGAPEAPPEPPIRLRSTT